MKFRLLFLLLYILYCSAAFPQTEATTLDGRKVLLYPDGSWKPITKELEAIPINRLELPKPKPFELVLNHTGYTLSYNTSRHIANWAAYELTAEETIPFATRTDRFLPDPLLKSGSASNDDYKMSGFDKGHLVPAADMAYSEKTMEESFYLSNIAPQVPGFNRGVWKKLEEQIRQWAVDNQALYIVTGGVLTKELPTMGSNKIPVPRYFYKVILDYTEPDLKGIGFIIPNKASKEHLQHFAVSIDSVEKVTKIDFFYQLPDAQERLIENTVDLSKWSWKKTPTP